LGLAIIVGLLATAGVASRVAAAPACGGPDESAGIVRAVVEARTLLLEDGRRVALDGIEVPDASAAEKSLTARLVGKPVTLRAEAKTDRHGRLRAFVFSRAAGLEASVQHDMVLSGLARAAPLGGGTACAAELLAREREARGAGRGLWADSRNAVRRADDPASILEARGHMAVVEGRVLSVRESGGTIYVNFGRRWSQDFTVTIAKRSERVFSASGLPPKGLERRQVRVRGWIEERGGPWIEATSPEQIEIVGPQELRNVR
jgi:endonuclease YncB( thermonuclease family)